MGGPWSPRSRASSCTMDGLVVPLAPKLLVACTDAMEDWLVALLRGRGFEFVEVGYAEARNLGVNLVALGNDRVLSMRDSRSLKRAPSSHGVRGLRSGHVDVHAGWRGRPLPVSGALPGRGVDALSCRFFHVHKRVTFRLVCLHGKCSNIRSSSLDRGLFDLPPQPEGETPHEASEENHRHRGIRARARAPCMRRTS